MEVSEELKDKILEGHIFDTSKGLHGFVIIIDDSKIWQSSNGVYLYSSKQQAMQTFYNSMKWRCAREAGLAMAESDGDYHYDTSRETWINFKKACNFKIKEI